METNINCPDWIHLPRLEAQGGKNPKSDTKKKLYVNPEKNVAICHRCGFKTRRADELLSKLNLRLAFQQPAYSRENESRPQQLSLPSEYEGTFHTSQLGRRAWGYLIRRYIPPEVICAYELGFCATGEYAGRIIIPMYEGERLVNFQARDFLGREPRYLSAHASQGADRNTIFNLDRASQSGVLMVVEGPFDVLRLPDYAIALLGSTKWNEQKRERIIRANPKIILLALDNDDAGIHAEEAIRHSLAGLSVEMASIRLPGKDIGELSPRACEKLRGICASFADAVSDDSEGTQHCLP